MHDVTFVVYDDFQSLDPTGPLEVLHGAGRAVGGGAYRIRVLGPDGATVRSSSGLRFEVDGSLHDPVEEVGTLVVVGGDGCNAAAADPHVVTAVDRLAARATRITSVCSGALVLAATGRLDGRRATTHWARCAELAHGHPAVEVDPDAIFVRDGDLWTSAGVTAGMDLALALVTEDHGAEVAHTVASWLVMFVQRAGGQSQFSPQLVPASRTEPLRDLLAWIADHPDADLSVTALARRAAMSERHLTRLFARELGTTPAAYVESVRIDAARRLLETTDLTVAAVAARVGFRSDAVLHRAFGRTVRTTPATYRRHFSTTGGRAVPTDTRS
ncbi:GlxA family transcriptional regulator [Actinomarinicola tropica]|uniref:Helix-turn-helix domain-containing protein n=1 Tax=Actinomarinicola tropica TaxID=2789776 RepID=A0A5Q2RP03_9ACTN|nr:GlxA family transcriptional regulator [Actinomarinicola tropica]QGG96156.1 helix-turn-helix domain-containing protein [Actinomarinicola tropica]